MITRCSRQKSGGQVLIVGDDLMAEKTGLLQLGCLPPDLLHRDT
jgi:hypothetical protein